jgi:hypothetical protein
LSPNPADIAATPWKLNAKQFVTKFAHLLQRELFPRLEATVGPLSKELELLSAVMALVPLQRLLWARRASTGRPAKDRAALATAFIAKAILNLPNTRDLIGRLRVDQALRQLCGWRNVKALPHESKFSRAFAEFAVSELAQQLHAAVIAGALQNCLIGHIARDSTAITAPERFAERAHPKKKRAKPSPKKRGPAKGATGKKKKEKEKEKKSRPQNTRIAQQRQQNLAQMLKDLPCQCDIGAKTNSKGHHSYWRGYKLHLDVADGQVPISALLTSASVHDSQAAIPLMTMTAQRVVHLYELMDSAYDAAEIHAHSRQLNHVPIIEPHGRRGTKKPSQLPKIFPPKPTPELSPAQRERYKTRTMSERVNARLKEEFGANQLRVRGAAKVMAHLMFGVLALTVDQWLRLRASG